MRKLDLVAVVSYHQGRLLRAKVVTDIVINLDGEIVASAVKGGRYSQQQALAEFRRNPGAFAKGPAFPLAKTARLVA